ncbi:acyl-CoA dehydrogenase [Brachybacterium sp. JB7]|uniref:acyl-CoA oxidase n=1 Tax=Brachybacterium alimentarium TaxID=47845 RepID=A0A2A3YM07_9MICO|nr:MULTISPECIES: acyl-CoA dehydrogenase [Brachybacterium]PCC35872.1 acyl-CoA dehydrogenase [Brachybacterium alimentarium]PCC40396.1 acyl-CoA dehydrogenase [Brachybacterium alimentarium]RCS63452.1 acyl-CoA dehydrogenase [Brachybacterium sp. JB7]RCS67768.1 acyl-CoA dehydrogenase [Brachybacterium alimentarium]RCS68150.1 acyl-CoA dehydrogenase [Brachybacterium alimentarium]
MTVDADRSSSSITSGTTVPTSPTSPTPTGPIPVPPAGSDRLDIAAVTEVLMGTWADARRDARERAARPEFHRPTDLTVAEHRDLTFEQMKRLAEENVSHLMLPEHLGGPNDNGGNVASFEELVVADPSLQIKAGVQWGLFTSAIVQLGDEQQQKAWVPDAMDLTTPGAFAMTEIGHGSDVQSLATTATYDASTEEWVLHTPFRAAWKEFLGNAAIHAKAATVFARLITRGVDHGVHCFYVPVRDAEGELLPGVRSEDDGPKGGLNGIDNGRLAFDHVRIPRTNLLNRYGDVAADGTYASPIESPGRRFFTMLGTLVQGRVSLDGSATRASQLALHIAITYATQRRQFTASDPTRETVLMDYQAHLHRLLPKLAATYAGSFAHEQLLHAFDDVFSGHTDDPEAREDLETLAAALKPTSTRLALDTIQECREACGGAGFISENQLVGLHQDLDVYATFEGDNTVLLQLVAKRLLSDYTSELKSVDRAGIGRFIAQRAEVLAKRHTPWARLAQDLSDRGNSRRAFDSMRQSDFQEEMLTARARVKVEEVALSLRAAGKMSPADAAAEVNKHQVEMLDAARAHADLVRWRAFTAALEQMEDPATRGIMTDVRDLFGLSVIEDDLAWFLLGGMISAQRGRQIGSDLRRLLWRLRPHVLDLVAAFDVRPGHVRAPIALGGEHERQEEAAAYFRAQRASADAPVSEKALRDREKKARRSTKR